MTVPNKGKLSLTLSPNADLHFSVPAFLHHEFNYARRLEKGLASGIEPEFNHQYRVTLRRIRTLCMLLHETIPRFELGILKPNLKLLMRQTNVLRDLDVFIIGRSAYFDMLPKRIDSLKKVFTHIEVMQSKEQLRVKQWLQSDGYHKTCVLLNNSLNRAAANDNELIHSSTLHFSNNKVLGHFKKVIKASRQLSPNSPDEQVHNLRLKCKKLRYLLEYFSDLYTDERHKSNVKHLKYLQDSLGDFNDTSSQLAFFKYLQESNIFSQEERKTVKVLIKQLKKHHHNARLSVLEHLNEFQHTLNQKASLSIYR